MIDEKESKLRFQRCNQNVRKYLSGANVHEKSTTKLPFLLFFMISRAFTSSSLQSLLLLQTAAVTVAYVYTTVVTVSMRRLSMNGCVLCLKLASIVSLHGP